MPAYNHSSCPVAAQRGRLQTAIPVLSLLVLLFQSACLTTSEPSLLGSIVVYGDSRTGHKAHLQVVEAILDVEPATVFHTGDLVANGHSAADWEQFFAIAKPLLDTADFYPCLGNHENNSPRYFENFDLPNNERWYDVEVENILWIVLDTNTSIHPGTDQYEWFLGQLENPPENTRFTAVVFHHPPFSSGPHKPDEKNLREYLVPLFETYGVDIVFSGHDHLYERSEKDGVIYVISGGGGAPLYDCGGNNPYSIVCMKSYHFCSIEVFSDHLDIAVLDTVQQSLDRFSIIGD